jgi:hypothetical protein
MEMELFPFAQPEIRNMKIRALIIAAALSSGAAFAASPNDTAKAGADTDAKPPMGKSMSQGHKMGKHHAMHRAAHRGTSGRSSGEMASSAPSTDTSAEGRQSRMDEALAKYRQHG